MDNQMRNIDDLQTFILFHHTADQLTHRVINALVRADICTMGQLASMSREQIDNVRNIGEKGQVIIYSALEKYRIQMDGSALDTVAVGQTEE